MTLKQLESSAGYLLQKYNLNDVAIGNNKPNPQPNERESASHPLLVLGAVLFHNCVLLHRE